MRSPLDSRLTRSPLAFVGLTACVALTMACGGDDTAAPSTTPDPDALPNVPPDQLEGFVRDWANAIRDAADLDPLLQFPELSESAAQHAVYLASDAGGLELHRQVPGTSGFVAETAQARAEAALFPEVVMGELVAFRRNATVAPLWLGSPFGLALVLQPHAKYFGYGNAPQPADLPEAHGPADVMLVGWKRSSPPDGTTVVLHPPAGATDVKPSWSGEAVVPPCPTPDSGWPAGPVVMAVPPVTADVTVASARLEGPDGATVPHVRIAPDHPVAPGLLGAVVMYADAPLAPAATYTATIEGTLDGAAWSESWSFSTRAQ